MLSLEVLNELRLGRDMAAKVTPMKPDNVAWVYVLPLLDKQKGDRVCYKGQEPQFFAFGEESPHTGFLVRYIEILATEDQEYREQQRDGIARFQADIRIEVKTEDELDKALLLWISDSSTLRHPHDVGYWDERFLALQDEHEANRHLYVNNAEE